MKFLFIFLSLVFFLNSNSQEIIRCEGLQKASNGALVKINGTIQKKQIRKADLINYGLQLALNDYSYNVIGFIVSYDCHSRSLLFDINAKTYLGNRVKSNDNFIKQVWVGDQLCIECINVENDGKKFIISSMCFQITE